VFLELVQIGLFWLLLPVAAASGWYAGRMGRRGAPKDRRRAPGVSHEYFRGLNYLLNEQPDKAIEVFISLLDVDNETVETHLALGNLFRRRGEVDRAIRIHQNLVARPGLDRNQHALAVQELAMDYLRSGLLDRAESLFSELTTLGAHKRQALRQLVHIYQQEQDWDKAIEASRLLESETGVDLSAMVAHFYCERVELARRRGDFERAQALVAEALGVDPKCVRASILEGEIAASRGADESAVAAYQRVASQDEAYVPETIYPLLASHRRLGTLEEFRRYLEALAERHMGITPVLVLAELLAERGELRHATRRIAEELRRRPSVRGLDRLADYALQGAAGETLENLKILKEFTSKLLENRAVYRCRMCGFTGKSLHWQCPGCKEWNSVKPIHGIEGE
jgi:lipopolysaccharide biosynthesis regulator YciM